MKKTKVLSLMAFAFLALAMNSCLGDSDTVITSEQSLAATSNMSYVTDLTTGEEYMIGTGASYNFRFESVSQKMTVSATGLQLIAGAGSYTFEINDVPFKYDSFGAIAAKVESFHDAKNNVSISDFDINYAQRSIGYMNIPVWTITYTVDERFRIRVVQNAIYYFGETKVTDIPTQSSLLDNKTVFYAVSFDPKTLNGKDVEARINIYNILLPDTKVTGNYLIEQNLKANFSANDYTLNGTDCKLFYETNKATEFTVNSASANATFLLKDDGKKRNPNIEFAITLNNKYRLTAVAGLSFTEELVKEYE